MPTIILAKLRIGGQKWAIISLMVEDIDFAHPTKSAIALKGVSI